MEKNKTDRTRWGFGLGIIAMGFIITALCVIATASVIVNTIILPNQVPPLTQTAVATPGPSPTPTPTPPPLVEEFDRVLDPERWVQTDLANWVIRDGALVFLTAETWFISRDAFDGYRVDLQVRALGKTFYTLDIGLNLQGNSGVVLRIKREKLPGCFFGQIGSCDLGDSDDPYIFYDASDDEDRFVLRWEFLTTNVEEFKTGGGQVVPVSQREEWLDPDRGYVLPIRIDVVNNRFRVTANGSQVLAMVIPRGPTHGRVGIRLDVHGGEDGQGDKSDAVIEHLRVEYP